MSESAKKKSTPRKKDAPARSHESRRETTNEKQSDSDDVERAVYDGMQDLRVKKPG